MRNRSQSFYKSHLKRTHFCCISCCSCKCCRSFCFIKFPAAGHRKKKTSCSSNCAFFFSPSVLQEQWFCLWVGGQIIRAFLRSWTNQTHIHQQNTPRPCSYVVLKVAGLKKRKKKKSRQQTIFIIHALFIPILPFFFFFHLSWNLLFSRAAFAAGGDMLRDKQHLLCDSCVIHLQ